jgi:hypothetical protein
MITATNLLYSKNAIARMENIPVSEVVRFEVWASVVFVIIRGRRPKFYSKRVFKRHFVEHRREQAKEICTNRVKNNWFRAINPRKGTAYDVYALRDGIDCTCEDFSNQIRFFETGCCKHGYAVLLYELGFTTLADYVEQQRWVDTSHPPFEEEELVA